MSRSKPVVIERVSDDEVDESVMMRERVMCSHPSCQRWISLKDLESHELCHQLTEEEEIKSMEAEAEAGKLLAAAMQEEEDFLQLQQRYGFIPAPRQGRCFTCGKEGHWSGDNECPSKSRPHSLSTVSPRVLIASQQRDRQYQRVIDECRPLIPLLAKTLSEQKACGKGYEAYLCGPVCLLAGESHDRGWGCGYRNIQMLASHLLMKEGAFEIKKVLFGGCNFIPDVQSLQAWLELAWGDGFDPPGCESLGGSVQGSNKWIGTTEACSILRYFGLQAEIVDFKSKSSSSFGARFHRREDGKAVHPGVECDMCGACPIIGARHHSRSKANYDVCNECENKAVDSGPYEITGRDQDDDSGSREGEGGGGRKESGLAIKLMAQVWNYFHTSLEDRSTGGGERSTNGQKVTVTSLPPLYFQHDGHSRTIIGIEKKKVARELKQSAVEAAATLFGGPSAWASNKSKLQEEEEEFTLLILDPGIGPQRALEEALMSGRGWQRFLRRSTASLSRHDELQLLMIKGDELAGERERQESKHIKCKELIEAD